jgi:hypothetical protein
MYNVLRMSEFVFRIINLQFSLTNYCLHAAGDYRLKNNDKVRVPSSLHAKDFLKADFE